MNSDAEAAGRAPHSPLSAGRSAAGERASPHVLKSLPILILYPHSRCNCRCLMCDIWKVTTAEEISVEDLQAHAEDIRALKVEWVVFSGGEPLMHSDLFRLAAILADCGVRTTLLTTGLLLARYAPQIVRSIDDVIVSLDGPPEAHDRIRRTPGAFAQLEQGVAALRQAAGPRGYPVSARCTVQRANFRELRGAIATARELRLDSISFLAADLTSPAFNRPGGWPQERRELVGLAVSEIEAFESEMEALISVHLAEIDSGFIREDVAKLRRLVRHFRAALELEPAQAPRCNAPWVSAVLESDGTLRPCFFHPPLGNARPGQLLAALNSDAALAFRSQLDVAADPICRRCVCSLYLPPKA